MKYRIVVVAVAFALGATSTTSTNATQRPSAKAKQETISKDFQVLYDYGEAQYAQGKADGRQEYIDRDEPELVFLRHDKERLLSCIRQIREAVVLNSSWSLSDALSRCPK
jgi:hypothetical protein